MNLDKVGEKISQLDCPAQYTSFLAELPVDSILDERKLCKPLDVGTYHRDVLFENSSCEFVLFFWGPGVKTPIHDHGEECEGALRLLKGSVRNELFHEDSEDQLSYIGDEFLHSGYVGPLEKGIIHRVSNASEDHLAVSLHLYSPLIENSREWESASVQSWASL